MNITDAIVSVNRSQYHKLGTTYDKLNAQEQGTQVCVPFRPASHDIPLDIPRIETDVIDDYMFCVMMHRYLPVLQVIILE